MCVCVYKRLVNCRSAFVSQRANNEADESRQEARARFFFQFCINVKSESYDTIRRVYLIKCIVVITTENVHFLVAQRSLSSPQSLVYNKS